MAANMPQMGGGAPVRQRPPHQQLSQLVYTQMMTHAGQTNGWQDQVQTNLRVSNAMNLISNSFLAMPSVDSQQLVSHGLAFEREAFLNSPDKVTYDQKIGGRVQELFKRRQAHEQSLQNTLNAQAQAQAAAQAQAQMLMNQNMVSRGMGQPPQQGFQHLQQQMQPSPIPQQAHQPGMGMAGPGGVSMNPNQQAMQMGAAQMRPQIPMHATLANLSAQDRTKVTQLALAKLNQTPEPQRNSLRLMLQQKFSPQQMAQLQQENMDPVLYFFQNQILQASKGQAGANVGGNQAAMQAQQRQMNQAGQQLAGVPGNEFGPFSNVESIMNQQKAGLLAQEAGQMVVPASTGPGRNATPQPMGGVQGPNPGNHLGPNQAGIPNQMQQQFNLPQAQQLKMDQRAAQSQAQIRAQAQAKQMQGQPGGLNGPGTMSHSPGLNTLNTPVRRTPVGMGQVEGQPQMGQPNGPFGQGLDPRFNQNNQRPQMGGNPNNAQIINTIISAMDPGQRNSFMALPPEKRNEMFMRWTTGQARASGQMAGRGQQPQPNQFGQGNHMAQFGPGNNVGQQPNPNMPMNPQNQMLLQQQLNRMRNNMHNQNRPQGAPDTNAFMDSLDVPQRILEQLRSNQAMPQEIKKWGQLKQWLVQKNANPNMISQLQNLQNAQFQNILKQRAAAGNQMPQPNMPPQGPQPHGAQMPTHPVGNMGPFPPGLTITAAELQHAKNHERFRGMPDDKIRSTLLQMKMQSLRAKASGQVPNTQMQTPQTSQPGNANVATSAPPLSAPNVPQQRPQNMGPDPNAANSTATARNNRQPQNNRPPQTAPSAPPQKNGLKRASTDDVVEVPNPSSTPVQRPPSQQAQGQGNMPQMPQLNAAQLASLPAEQRSKYEAMLKSRQAAAAGAGGASAQQAHMSEEMQRLKAIGQEEHIIAAKEPYHEIPMTPEQYADMAQKIQSMVGEMGKISKILGRWYTLTRDDNRARMFFKMRLRLVKQFVDGDKMTTLKKAFSLRPKDLDGVRGMLEGMARDVATQYPQVMKRNLNQQQNASESGTQQGANDNTATPPTGQPAPLNAANLEKQTQALSKMHHQHQRTASKSGQPPAAPTTSQPPFPFGAQSPNGQPTYMGKAAITATDLQLPARKKARTGTQSGMGSGGPSANSSPQVPKATSPEMKRTETKPAPKLQYQCPEESCEAHGIGFATQEARQHHIEEEHVKPRENPFKFVTESLATALGLEPDGNPKAPPNASTTAAGVSQVSAPPMAHDVSRQGQTPTSRADATPMSRDSSMKRQGSAAGSRPAELSKTVTGRIGTPKPDTGFKGGDGTAGSGKPPVPVADGAWQMTTIDPADLFNNIGGLESGGNGAIADMSVYRAITPNDTPESSKDSASSEPNSDVSEGVSLNLTLNMGFDVWNPFGGGPHIDLDAPDMDLTDVDLTGGENAFPAFSWDDVNIDFTKEFQLDTSLYSLDTT